MNIISAIVTEAETLGKEAGQIWDHVVQDVEADIAAVKKAFPAAATTVDQLASDVKQGASDALGIGATLLGEAQPAIVNGVNGAADAGLLALTGGKATPVLPAVNGWIDGLVATGIATLQAWALKQKSMLATAAVAAAPAAPAPAPAPAPPAGE